MERVLEIEADMGKNARKPSDMNAPKRPLSAYFQWANKARPAVMKAHPDWSVAQVGKQLGKDWKSVSSGEKAAIQAKVDKEKASYAKKLAAYQKTGNYKTFQHELLAWKIHETKKAFGPDKNAPTRPLSAYTLHATSVRDEIVAANPGIAHTAIMKEQGVWWKALSEAERAPWVAKAAKAAAGHQKVLAKYQKTAEYQAYAAEKAAYKEAQVAKRHKLMGVKKKNKRARCESAPKKAKKAKRARRSSSRRSSRRARTPKSSKRRSASRRRAARQARTPKAPKAAASSGSEAPSSKKARRRRCAPRPSKSRSTSRSTKGSSRRARTP